MGLDMYLTKKTYIGSMYEHRKPKVVLDIEINDKKVNIDNNSISSIEEEFMYWRKANHIHSWFVENVQDGVDDCAEYRVEKDNLKDLIKSCNILIHDPREDIAELILPTQSGFFFGGTEYDAWYYLDTLETRNKLETIKKEDFENFEISFYYQSSW